MSAKTLPPRVASLEPIGKRIAQLRLQRGWTQQALAARLAISRVAISHIEMDLTLPGERTIALLASLFKLTPHELVDGTTYPRAKTERLPLVVCWYTKLELDLALLEADLAWLERLVDTPQWEYLKGEVQEKWSPHLMNWARDTVDERDQNMITAAQTKLAAACDN